jgi:hypothetical protein
LEKGFNRSFKRFSSVFFTENKSNFDNRMSILHLAHLDEEVSQNEEKSSSRTSTSISRPDINNILEDRSNLSLGQSAADAGLLGSSDTMDSTNSSSMSVISKRDFTFGLSLLEKHKKWAEKAARK